MNFRDLRFAGFHLSNVDDRPRAQKHIEQEMEARKPDQESPQGYQPDPTFQKRISDLSDDVFKVFNDMLKTAKTLGDLQGTEFSDDPKNQKKMDEFKAGLETISFAEKLLVHGRSKINKDFQLANLDKGQNASGTGRSYTQILMDEAKLPSNFGEIQRRKQQGLSVVFLVQ